MASTLSTKNQAARKKSTSSTVSQARLSTQAGNVQFWRDSAPQDITGDQQWKLWARHLEIRRAPAPLGRLLTGRTSPLLWGVNQGELSSGTVELISTLDSLRATGAQSNNQDTAIEVSLAKWLKECGNAEHSVDTALQALAVAYAMPKLANRISSGVWWQLLDTLWSLVQKNDNWRSDSELPPQQGWAQQLLVGELPLTLSYLFPEIRSLHKLRSDATDALTEGLVELTNGDGLLSGPYLSILRPLAGCWTRCRAIGDKNKKGCWKRKAEDQFQFFVTQAIRLTTADGSALLGEPHSQSWTPEFLRTLLQLGGHRSDNAAVHAFAKKKITRDLDEPKKTPLPEPADNCDWAGVAIMRTDWDRNAATVAVDYSTPRNEDRGAGRCPTHRGRHLGLANHTRWQAARASRMLGRSLLV